MQKRPVENDRNEKMDPMTACIIIGAVLLCVLLSFFGFLKNRDATAAAVAATAETGESPVREDGQLADPLLVLVNDETPLPADWKVTPRMIDDELVDLRMYDDLTAMFDAAAKDDVWFWVASGYRSVEQQEIILDRAVNENMEQGMTRQDAEKTALRTIQRPGCSEHHTGLAVDLNDVSDDFERTEAYFWLSQHAAEYGFIQRYRGEKASVTGIGKESWHYRYVGKRHAKEMERLGLCLEEYVQYLKKGELQ